MRFDDEGYVRDWRERRRFPKIHDAIFDLIGNRAKGVRFLDLCCSTGLLGRRLLDCGVAEFCCGVDADPKAIELSRRYGVNLAITPMRVDASTLPHLAELIRATGVTVVAGRRCLPEILGPHPHLDAPFAATLADAGVDEVFLQGRVESGGAVNRLASVDREIETLASRFRLVARQGSCAYLRAG